MSSGRFKGLQRFACRIAHVRGGFILRDGLKDGLCGSDIEFGAFFDEFSGLGHAGFDTPLDAEFFIEKGDGLFGERGDLREVKNAQIVEFFFHFKGQSAKFLKFVRSAFGCVEDLVWRIE